MSSGAVVSYARPEGVIRRPSFHRTLTFPEVPWLIPFFSIVRQVAMISFRNVYSASVMELFSDKIWERMCEHKFLYTIKSNKIGRAVQRKIETINLEICY